MPDGCTDLLWIESGPVVVCGPETTSWEFSLPAGTRACGVRLRPGAARRLLRTDIHELTNRRVRLGDISGSGTERRLAEQLAEADDALVVLERTVGRWLGAADSKDRVDEAITVAGLSPRPPSVGGLADGLALSSRQIHRRAERLFGYGFSTLTRLVRFQRLVLDAQRGHRASLAALAAGGGYADQAHLARECRAITGLPPSEFLLVHDATFPAASDPYKTTPPAVVDDGDHV